ncbi:hypothetical protein MPDQ_006919 [Monascus purpureus]|uniref:HAUS augmin-like complex subunit 1 n=1 Tax=Monascus purpureus TaxID=5098 RepID=A0A507QX38_MONPU|nr:hypothetical protein MPDQ_006919 [Monascus purpureus]BDD55597.1 hypothetical protein MAP00_001095 [Monascus purpureus]
MDPSSSIDASLFSPSKARQAAIQAKDWAYVNSWLSRQYAPKPVPNFEHNEDTLRTLLTLAAANDAADEEATLLHRAREEAVRGFKAQEDSEEKQKRELLDEVEICLDENGRRDLDDLAETAVVLGSLSADTSDLAQSIIDLSMEEFEARDQISKVEALQRYLENELHTIREQLYELKSNKAYEISSNLPALTAEWSRSTKLLATKVGEYEGRIASLERNRAKGPTIEELVAEEEDVKKIEETVQALEGRVRMFNGLPQDAQEAKLQYKQLERELDRLTQRRDSLFESLVGRRRR